MWNITRDSLQPFPNPCVLFSVDTTHSTPLRLIPSETELQPPLPTIVGNVDYHDFRATLLRIDELLLTSGAEEQWMRPQSAPSPGPRFAPRPTQCQVPTHLPEAFPPRPALQPRAGVAEGSWCAWCGRMRNGIGRCWTRSGTRRLGRAPGPSRCCDGLTACWRSDQRRSNRHTNESSASGRCPTRRRYSVCIRRRCT